MNSVAGFPHCAPLTDFWGELCLDSVFEFCGIPWGEAVFPLTFCSVSSSVLPSRQLAIFLPCS